MYVYYQLILFTNCGKIRQSQGKRSRNLPLLVTEYQRSQYVRCAIIDCIRGRAVMWQTNAPNVCLLVWPNGRVPWDSFSKTVNRTEEKYRGTSCTAVHRFTLTIFGALVNLIKWFSIVFRCLFADCQLWTWIHTSGKWPLANGTGQQNNVEVENKWVINFVKKLSVPTFLTVWHVITRGLQPLYYVMSSAPISDGFLH